MVTGLILFSYHKRAIVVHAIVVDENGHSDRNTDDEIKRQNTIEQELGCKFI